MRIQDRTWSIYQYVKNRYRAFILCLPCDGQVFCWDHFTMYMQVSRFYNTVFCWDVLHIVDSFFWRYTVNGMSRCLEDHLSQGLYSRVH